MIALLRLLFAIAIVVSSLAGAFFWGFVAGRAQETATLRLILDQLDPCWEVRRPDPATLATQRTFVWCTTVDDAPRVQP